jgi:hypothetical protein
MRLNQLDNLQPARSRLVRTRSSQFAGMGIGTEAVISLQFQRLDRGTEVTVDAG